VPGLDVEAGARHEALGQGRADEPRGVPAAAVHARELRQGLTRAFWTQPQHVKPSVDMALEQACCACQLWPRSCMHTVAMLRMMQQHHICQQSGAASAVAVHARAVYNCTSADDSPRLRSGWHATQHDTQAPHIPHPPDARPYAVCTGPSCQRCATQTASVVATSLHAHGPQWGTLRHAHAAVNESKSLSLSSTILYVSAAPSELFLVIW
jgi:hypothetical protein